MEDSLARLDKLTQEEARMASAELLEMTHSTGGKVTGVDDRLKGAEGNVQDVRSDVQDEHAGLVVVIVDCPLAIYNYDNKSLHRLLIGVVVANEQEDSPRASDGDVGSVAVLDDKQAALVVMIEYVGLEHALFGDHAITSRSGRRRPGKLRPK